MEKRGLFLTNRHVSWALSFFILFSFFVFIGGYFLGKKKTVEKFYNKVDQDSLSDHIYYSVCSIYDNEECDLKQESTEEGSSASEKVDEEPVLVEDDTVKPVSKGAKIMLEKQTGEEKSDEKQAEKFYAELVGFGTLKAANNFVAKLKKAGFDVALKKRKSRSAKGKNVFWYQVVTEKFDNKSDLIAFVDIIKEKEKLKSAKIIQCD